MTESAGRCWRGAGAEGAVTGRDAGKGTRVPRRHGEGPAYRTLAAARPAKGAAADKLTARGPDRLAQRAHGGEHGGRLVAAVRHAVGAARVLAASVGVPVGGLDELLIRLHVPVVQQVAGLLPAEQRVGGNAPRGAAEVGLALEEVKEQRRVVQPPLLPPAVRERLAEQLPGLLHAEEVLLV